MDIEKKGFEIDLNKVVSEVTDRKENADNISTFRNQDPASIAKIFANLSRKSPDRVLVVPIGFPNAGKSMFLSSLIYHARKTELIFTEESAEPFTHTKVLTDKWVESLSDSKWVQPTRVGDISLLGLKLAPAWTQGKYDNKVNPYEIKLALLDLAGEDIEKIKVSNNHELSERIDAIFKGMNVFKTQTIFVLLTPYNNIGDEDNDVFHKNEDTLMYDFLNYIKEKEPDIHKNAQYLVLVSKWSDCKNPEAEVPEYLKEYRPQLYNIINGSNVQYSNYSVGNILNTKVNGVLHSEIINIEYESPRKIWKKLYNYCTDRDLEHKSIFSKMFKFFS